MLHKSNYYKEDIVKYYKCKKCERTRLAKMRNANRYVQMNCCCCYCCPSCHGAIDMEAVYAKVGCSFYDCKCGVQARLRHKKKSDTATGETYYPAQLKCDWCDNYSCPATSAFTCAKMLKGLEKGRRVAEENERARAMPEATKVPPLVLKLSKK